MNLKFLKIGGKVVVKIFIFYFSVFGGLIFSFSAVTNYNLSYTSNNQDKEFNINNLKIVKDSVDDVILSIKYSFDYLTSTKWIDQLLYFENDINKQHTDYTGNAFLLKNFIEDLSNIKHSSPGMESIGVVFKGGHFVVDNYNAFNAVDYFKKIYKVDDLEVDKWLSMMDNFHNFEVLPSENIILNNTPCNGMIFYKTIPAYASNAKGLIFALISQETFCNALEALIHNNESFGLIIDKNNRIIAQTSNFHNDIPVLSYEEYNASDFIDNVNLTRKYEYYSTNIDFLSWKLIFIKLNAKSVFTYLNHLPIIILLILLTLVISYLLSRYNYNLFSKLFYSFDILDTKKNDNIPIFSNIEYSIIEKKITKVKQK